MTKFTTTKTAIAFAILAVIATPFYTFMLSSLTTTTTAGTPASTITTDQSDARYFEDFLPCDAVVVTEECPASLHESPAKEWKAPSTVWWCLCSTFLVGMYSLQHGAALFVLFSICRSIDAKFILQGTVIGLICAAMAVALYALVGWTRSTSRSISTARRNPFSNHASRLHWECEYGAEIGTIRATVERDGFGALFVRDRTGCLPLHVACRYNAPIEVIRFLLMAGGDRTLFIRDHSGCLPVHAACLGLPFTPIITLLVQQGGVATLRTRNQRGELPLHVLCGSDPTPESVQFLVQQCPEAVSTMTLAGDLPLFLACEASRYMDVIRILLREYPEALGF